VHPFLNLTESLVRKQWCWLNWAVICKQSGLNCYTGSVDWLKTAENPMATAHGGRCHAVFTCLSIAMICCEERQSWKLCHGALREDFRARCSSGLITNSFVTNAVLMQKAELLTSVQATLANYTILDSWFRFPLKWTKSEIVVSRGGTCPSIPWLVTPMHAYQYSICKAYSRLFNG